MTVDFTTDRTIDRTIDLTTDLTTGRAIGPTVSRTPDLMSDCPTDRELVALEKVAERLARTFPDVAATRVQAIVARQFQRFEGSRIRDFVPIFVERFARDELSTLTS